MMEFVEVRVTDLNGSALDWAVAKAEGVKYDPYYISCGGYRRGAESWSNWFISNFQPSTDWSKGGPLIESEQIELSWDGYDGEAFWWKAVHQDLVQFQMGDTPLIAACRAIVAAKLGETVSVPKEFPKC